jgi:hypothetical protein
LTKQSEIFTFVHLTTALMKMINLKIGQSCIVGMNVIAKIVRYLGKIEVTRVSVTIAVVTWQSMARIILRQI